MGSAGHLGLEILANGGSDAMVAEAIREYYAPVKSLYDDIAYERETVIGLVWGYDWRWSTTELDVVSAEEEVVFPLRNPITGEVSEEWEVVAKLDMITNNGDDTIDIYEHKFLSEALTDDSPLYSRLTRDWQVQIYMAAAIEAGYNPRQAVYDVVCKPKFKPINRPILDENGKKIVVDSKGNPVYKKDGSPRLSEDSKKGYRFKKGKIPASDWAQYVLDDIYAKPDAYYQRKAIPRLDASLELCMLELWQLAKDLKRCQDEGHWYRTVTRDTCSWCPYNGLCEAGYAPELGEAPPEGFFLKEKKGS
jgi:hypothetical protein